MIPGDSDRSSVLLFAFCLIPFIVLATLNSGGYRYGASDQAFYLPAVMKAVDPELFPRDSGLLSAQTSLTLADQTLALVVRSTGMSLATTSAAFYLLALGLFAAGGWRIGTHLYGSRWIVVSFLAALTLRHAIARSGTNTLEGYFHPRTLAYGLGLLAVGSFLRGKWTWTAVPLVLAAAVHPTTTLWFVLWLAAAAAIVSRPPMRVVIPAAIIASGAAAWAILAGPLAGRLSPMDDQWLALLDSKDYLFPLQWPVYAWVFNLGYLIIIGLIYRQRLASGLVTRTERGLVLGSSVLLLVFAMALVGHAARVALSFQLQPARVFWMFDLVAIAYAVWWLAQRAGRHWLAAAAIACFSITRGVYVLSEAERPAVQINIPNDDWGRVMAWARTTPKGSGWLADPLHAIKYGSSVRVAGERDVYVEAVKDAALGMYSRDVAVRTSERVAAVGPFYDLTPQRAREIAVEYDMDFIVTEQWLDLPMLFESGPLRVYRLPR